MGAQPSYADPGGSGRDSAPDGYAGPESNASYPDYKSASWSAAHKNNFTAADRGPDDIDTVVVHVTQGSAEGTKAWFKNPKSEVTTHYVVRSEDGGITQMVREANIAWHAGNWDVNKKSVGIEHEGYVDDPDKWFTDEMYKSSAKLVRDICERNDIPVDRDHIIAHSEVPGADHTDPGDGWDWDYYMDLIRGEGETSEPSESSETAETVDNDAGTYSGSWSTGQAQGQYGEDYAYADPAAVSDPLWYDVPLQEEGRYRLEVRYPASERNNTKTPYIVSTTSGQQTVYTDQTRNGGSWNSLGEFDMDTGDGPAVGLSRWTGGEGRVVADAVRLVKVS